MSGIVTQDEEEETTAAKELSRDELFDVLGHERRRCTIQFLTHREGEVELNELVDHVAAWENNKSIADVTSAERKRVRTALRQSHLPKMEEIGLVERDPNSDTVQPAESFTDLNVYLQVVGGRIPYSLLYLVLSVFSGGIIVGLWMNLPPLTIVPGVGWGALIVTLFGLTSLYHLYHTRRMELVPDFLSDIE